MAERATPFFHSTCVYCHISCRRGAPGPRETAMNETDKNPRSHGVSTLVEENETVNKIINKIRGMPGLEMSAGEEEDTEEAQPLQREGRKCSPRGPRPHPGRRPALRGPVSGGAGVRVWAGVSVMADRKGPVGCPEARAVSGGRWEPWRAPSRSAASPESVFAVSSGCGTEN